MRTCIASIVILSSIIVAAGIGYAEQLDAKTQQALIDAINDEYKARAVYQKVVDTYGDVRPFSSIIKAETTHVELLLPLFEKYGVVVPEDNWYEKVPVYATLQDACQGGVDAEIENAGMYDEFFAFVQEQDILDTFTRLRDASQDKHLPAFQRCVENGSGRGSGRGNGRGNGQGQKQGQGRNRK